VLWWQRSGTLGKKEVPELYSRRNTGGGAQLQCTPPYFDNC